MQDNYMVLEMKLNRCGLCVVPAGDSCYGKNTSTGNYGVPAKGPD